MNYDLNNLIAGHINNLWSFFITDEIKITRDFFYYVLKIILYRFKD